MCIHTRHKVHTFLEHWPISVNTVYLPASDTRSMQTAGPNTALHFLYLFVRFCLCVHTYHGRLHITHYYFTRATYTSTILNLQFLETCKPVVLCCLQRFSGKYMTKLPSLHFPNALHLVTYMYLLTQDETKVLQLQLASPDLLLCWALGVSLKKFGSFDI